MKHVILGAGGAVGNALTAELLENGQTVRLVSRRGYSKDGTEVLKGDLTNAVDCEKALEGVDIAHLCVGLPYDRKVWAEQWPVLMKNCIEACKKQEVKLIFFDNVYMYGNVQGKMTEDTPYNPCSVKGNVRFKLTRMLEDAMNAGRIQAIIARASDIYGPYGEKTSMPWLMVFDKLLQNKKPQWLFNAEATHSFTYIPDIAKGIRMLSECEDCFGQTWHLPTYNPAPTGKEFIEMAARELAKETKFDVLKMWIVKMVGLVNKTVKELPEMAYQFERDFYFDSTKFNKYFDYRPVSYKDGIKETIAFLQNQK
jgi:nucleoside-diphosphate-sugar epimerase